MSVTTVIVVQLFFQLCLGFTATYQGFDACGFGGWHCETDGDYFEVSFQCTPEIKDARLWIWTARVPHATTVLSVKNCRRVELHMDCTMGYRSYNLQRFHADNVTMLELLRPMRPHVFLHDNDMFSQAPPEMVFTNIQTLKWYPENFKAAGGRCRKKQLKLQRLVFQNVLIGAWANSLFKDQSLKALILSNVRFRSIQSGALTVDGIVLIQDSQLDEISSGNLDFTCNEMAINSSTLNKIGRGAINVEAKFFSFTNNIVTQADGKSFVIKAQNTRFVNNTWKNIGEDAFSEIKPNGSCVLANVYEFRDNHIEYLANGFAPNMEAFTNITCSHISIYRNIFPCDRICSSFKSSNINPFNYKNLLQPFTNFSDDNTCTGYPHKSVKETMIEISIDCGLIPTPTLPEPTTTEWTTTEEPETTTTLPETSETTTLNHELLTASASKGAGIIIPLSVAAVLFITSAVGTTLWVLKKRKDVQKNAVASYHHTSKTYDEEQLIDGQEDEDREEGAITIQSM